MDGILVRDLSRAAQLALILKPMLGGDLATAEANLLGILTPEEISEILLRGQIKAKIEDQLRKTQSLSMSVVAKELECSTGLVARVWKAMCNDYPQTEDSPARFRLGIPKEDRANQLVTQILSAAGFRLSITNNRTRTGVVVDMQNGIRPIPTRILAGQDIFSDFLNNRTEPLDLALVGNDKQMEYEAGGGKVVPLRLEQSFFANGFRMCLAVPQECIERANEQGLSYLDGRKIVTSYPETVKAYLENHGVRVAEIKYARGGVEAKCREWECDAIADIVETGGSLRAAGLEVFGETMFEGYLGLLRPERDLRRVVVNDDVDMKKFLGRLATVSL